MGQTYERMPQQQREVVERVDAGVNYPIVGVKNDFMKYK